MPLWWNGRHDSLRNCCRKACEFESRWGHQYWRIASKVDNLFRKQGQHLSRVDGSIPLFSANEEHMFDLDKKQKQKLAEWQKTKPMSKDALGTQYEYCFTPTSLGTVVVVKCLVTKTEINLTDYDSW